MRRDTNDELCPEKPHFMYSRTGELLANGAKKLLVMAEGGGVGDKALIRPGDSKPGQRQHSGNTGISIEN